jgi:hypothetical protein
MELFLIILAIYTLIGISWGNNFLPLDALIGPKHEHPILFCLFSIFCCPISVFLFLKKQYYCK